MKKENGKKRTYLDCHLHYSDSVGREEFLGLLEELGVEGGGLLCIPRGFIHDTLEEALRLKRESGKRFFVFGGMDWGIYGQDNHVLAKRLPEEALRLIQAGCDGIKMLEGKASIRRQYPIPDFDGAVWEPYWDLLERDGIPVVFHVNDPEEFWDRSRLSEYAVSQGWYYGDGGVDNEDQYRQVLNVLARHPRLRLMFAHFLFMGNQLKRLGEILDRFPGVCLDTAPAMEEYFHLSGHAEEAAAFFRRYQNRICFGTDIGARAVIAKEETRLNTAECRKRVEVVTDFLEKDGPYQLLYDRQFLHGAAGESAGLVGMDLSEDILDKIYRKNFLRFMGQDCPCRRSCEYHGNCAACRARHSRPGEKYLPGCERPAKGRKRRPETPQAEVRSE